MFYIYYLVLTFRNLMLFNNYNNYKTILNIYINILVLVF